MKVIEIDSKLFEVVKYDSLVDNIVICLNAKQKKHFFEKVAKEEKFKVRIGRAKIETYLNIIEAKPDKYDSIHLVKISIIP